MNIDSIKINTSLIMMRECLLSLVNFQDGLEGEQLCSSPVDGEKGNEDVNMGERWNCHI